MRAEKKQGSKWLFVLTHPHTHTHNTHPERRGRGIVVHDCVAQHVDVGEHEHIIAATNQRIEVSEGRAITVVRYPVDVDVALVDGGEKLGLCHLWGGKEGVEQS